MFNLFIPANVNFFFEFILELADFNVISVEDLLPMDGSIFAQLGVLFVVFLIGLILVPIIYLLKYLRKKSECIDLLYLRLSKIIFWN
jgi:hypothetical protein